MAASAFWNQSPDILRSKSFLIKCHPSVVVCIGKITKSLWAILIKSISKCSEISFIDKSMMNIIIKRIQWMRHLQIIAPTSTVETANSTTTSSNQINESILTTFNK